ncbi:putative arginyl-tRNA--protein transferase [Candidatus Micropelagos thuwalensis]|uniref:Putative arginyl-tRNA--protein transferase n=1 Tax=Candidatus Micropelagius thuwalensis TaxID=1397666 RepID=U2XP75_9PROT|nr:arginyl-tRNA-protein transferase [Candidatus Micropelagos thuwalensis]ERL46937.1 putative arginyl-tRNA--protein transferase [Candidatus Micropelagos thuwalensis]
MKPLLLTIALLFSTPAWAGLDENWFWLFVFIYSPFIFIAVYLLYSLVREVFDTEYRKELQKKRNLVRFKKLVKNKSRPEALLLLLEIVNKYFGEKKSEEKPLEDKQE